MGKPAHGAGHQRRHHGPLDFANPHGRQPFVHVNGSYHSQDWEGIVWYLRQAQPDLNVLTIHGDTQVDVWTPDSTALNRADFLLLTQRKMTHPLISHPN